MACILDNYYLPVHNALGEVYKESSEIAHVLMEWKQCLLAKPDQVSFEVRKTLNMIACFSFFLF